MRIKPGDPNSRFKGPGPGSYNPRVDYAKENLGTVKIGTGTRDQGKALPGGKDAPGPGQYTLGTSLSGPAFGIGTSQRDESKGQDIPGPGQYHVPTYIANLPRYMMPDRPESLRFL